MVSIVKVSNFIDYRFLIILFIGILLRIIPIFAFDSFFTRFYIFTDAYTYVAGAEGIITGDYNTHRPPSFPLFIVPFLLITGEPIIAVRLASFTSGILLIITSYFVFTKSSMKIFGEIEDERDKAKYVGFLVSLYISIHYNLASLSGMGRREEFMMTLLILIYYFIFVKENNTSLKNSLILILLISLFTLAHPTAGIFTFLTFLFFFIISKLRILKFSIISNIQMILISLSFILSLLFWFIFCFLKFGDPLYTFNSQNQYFQFSLDNISLIIIKGFNKGIAAEIHILFDLIGIVFILSCIVNIFYCYKERQILFLYGLILINFFYLSCFIAASGLERLIYYFFPFIFFLGFIFIINNFYEKKDMEIITLNFLKWKLKIILNHFFILFVLIFIIKQSLCFLYYFVNLKNNFSFFYLNFNEYIFYISIIGDIILFFIIIFPKYLNNKMSLSIFS